MRIPLHLNPNDRSEDANMARIKLHQFMASLTGGRGFRTPSARSAKKTRIERIGEESFA